MLTRLRKNKDKLKQEVQEMEQVELEIANENNESAGNFIGFILLDENRFDFNQFQKDLSKDWDFNIEISQEEIDKKTLAFELEDTVVTIGLKPTVVEDEEILEKAQANFYWPDALEVTKRHTAHLVVGVFNKSNTIENAGKLFVKVAASLLNQENATAINTLNIVFRGGFYRENAMITIKEEDRFPLLNLVFLELYTTDGTTVSAHTYGLEALGKKEIEIIESSNSMEDVHNLLYNIVIYILENNIILNTGETIGFDENQKLNIVESLGFAIDPNKTTLKIDY